MRRAAGTLLKLALAAVVAVFVWRSLASNWSEFGAIEFEFRLRPWWILLAALVTWLTYAIQIASWRTVLSGWGQRITYEDAARAWCVANLGRYVPGKLWSVAGLVALAQRSGVAPWAAGASAVVIQALGVATGVIVAAATLRPGTLAVGLAIALTVAVATLAVLAWERAVRWAGSTVGIIAGLRALPVGTVLASGALTLTSWVTYGAGFWCLALGLGVTGLPVAVAVGVFALGYLVGLMAVFVPGGVGVRELAFVGQLTPLVGSGPAIGVSVASRLLLTITEVTAALVALGASRKTKEKPVEHTER